MRNLLCFLMLVLPIAGLARPRQTGSVQLAVLQQSAASTADPNSQLYCFQVKCTNLGDKTVRITNNQFYVLDDKGQNHLVERARYRDEQMLDAGQSVTLDRIYIAVPRDSKPKELHLRGLGSCPLK
ncbi:hypothetical protein IV102_33600 [bacterium]|nr:hypothetical protein [bacterium]